MSPFIHNVEIVTFVIGSLVKSITGKDHKYGWPAFSTFSHKDHKVFKTRKRFRSFFCSSPHNVLQPIRGKICISSNIYDFVVYECSQVILVHVLSFGIELDFLTLSQTTNFRLCQSERVCRRQF